MGKYAVRPPKDLKSKYEAKMAKRAEDNRLNEIRNKQEEEEQRIAVSLQIIYSQHWKFITATRINGLFVCELALVFYTVCVGAGEAVMGCPTWS